MTPTDWTDLGWLGTARQLEVHGMTDRFAAAVAQRADELGVEVDGLDTLGPFLTIVTGTAKTYLGADKLYAYIEGLRDALSDSYGNPPVEVGRKDLELAIGALGSATGRAGFLDPRTTAAVDRLRQALREPSQRP